jgi:hypothetical protein
MRRLDAGDFARVVPLVVRSGRTGFTAMVYMVLEGRSDGKVFVNDPADPRAALILYLQGPYLEYDWGHLVGDGESPSFRRFVPELLSSHLPAGGAFLFPSSTAWRAQLGALFHRNFGRLVFEYPAGGLPDAIAELQVPAGFTVEAMSAASAERHGSPRHGGVRDPRESFGFCVMQGEEWVSHCYSNHIGGGEAEITIGTRGEFQRQGMATLAGAAFLRECLARSLRPAWSCDIDNLASAATARKLGFAREEELPGFYVHSSFLMWRDAAERGTRLGPSPVVCVREPAVVKVAEAIIDRAVRDGADGFIVAPDSRGVTIWHCKEGGAEEVSRLPRRTQLPLTAQFKLMTGMNAESQALPQAGRCSVHHGGTESMVRLRVHPSAYGERVVGKLEFQGLPGARTRP